MEMDGVKVSSRIDANTLNTITNSDGNIYSLPWSNSVTGLVYNATIFQEKNFKIPRTTDELIDLCAQIQNAYPGEKDPKPFIHYPSYWDFGTLSWMAQYAGVDNFTKYWKGIYTDENGVEKVNDISLFKDNVAAQKALKVLFDLLAEWKKKQDEEG
jgi:ABC-type glycerol-3-phosphate transport system substrate-binding protein